MVFVDKCRPKKTLASSTLLILLMAFIVALTLVTMVFAPLLSSSSCWSTAHPNGVAGLFWSPSTTTNNDERDADFAFGPSVRLGTLVPDDGVYFLETSGRPFINPKQLCAVEAGALHQPRREVVIAVGTDNLINTSRAIVNLQRTYPNIHFVRYQEANWFEGTVLADWWKNSSKKVQNSPHRIGHLSDILRIVALYNHGGIYLDLDVILMRDLDSLPKNSVPWNYANTGLANAVMFFEKTHVFLDKYLKAIVAKYNPRIWDYNGPKTLSLTLAEWCGGQLPRNNFTNVVICDGIHLLPNTRFYLPSKTWKKMYRNHEPTSKQMLATIGDAFLFHHWNHYSDWALINATNESSQAVGVIARKNCPVVTAAHDGLLWGYH